MKLELEIPTGDELLEEVKSEVHNKGGLYNITIMKVLIYLLMKDTGREK